MFIIIIVNLILIFFHSKNYLKYLLIKVINYWRCLCQPNVTVMTCCAVVAMQHYVSLYRTVV